jgi:hypothetical protein
MKTIFFAAISLALAAGAAFADDKPAALHACTGCSEKSENPLLGVWEVAHGGHVIMSLEFRIDGTRVQRIAGNESTAKYSVAGDKLTIVDGNRTEAYTFEIKGDKLTLRAVDSRKMDEYTRKPPVG